MAVPKIQGEQFWSGLSVVAEPKIGGDLAPARTRADGPSWGNVADGGGVHSEAGAEWR